MNGSLGKQRLNVKRLFCDDAWHQHLIREYRCIPLQYDLVIGTVRVDDFPVIQRAILCFRRLRSRSRFARLDRACRMVGKVGRGSSENRPRRSSRGASLDDPRWLIQSREVGQVPSHFDGFAYVKLVLIDEFESIKLANGISRSLIRATTWSAEKKGESHVLRLEI